MGEPLWIEPVLGIDTYRRFIWSGENSTSGREESPIWQGGNSIYGLEPQPHDTNSGNTGT